MKNLKKTIALLSALAMAGTMLAGCGTKGGDDTKTTTTAAKDETTKAGETTTAAKAAEVKDTNKHLVIYIWNEEFKGMFEKYYLKDHPLPDGYTYDFVLNPSKDNVYQNKLDEAIQKQADAADDDKIDMFLIEADYALKYVNSDATKDVKTVGITDDDLKNQYEYTKQIATDSNGVLKGVSWQATPGLFVYRRSIAKTVFGTDDPAKVQEQLADWDKFDAAAKTVKEKTSGKVTMLSGYADSYRTFSNNVSKPWVADNKIVVDGNITKWIDQTKTFTDNGYNQKTSLWDDNWTKGQGPNGNVFGYFYSTWGINFTLLGNSLATQVKDGGKEEVGNGIYGDWAACEGPQSYYWGGTWLAAAAGGNNDAIVADIMKYFTVDTKSMEAYSRATQDYVNNKESIKNITSSNYSSAFLGGQDHISLFAKSAEKINLKNISAYDQGLNEGIQTAMSDYFNGKSTKEAAFDNFYTIATTKYPELKK